MNVFARHLLPMKLNPLFVQGFRPLQAYTLLWSDVRSTSRRI